MFILEVQNALQVNEIVQETDLGVAPILVLGVMVVPITLVEVYEVL